MAVKKKNIGSLVNSNLNYTSADINIQGIYFLILFRLE